jgi:hypothetical protein
MVLYTSGSGGTLLADTEKVVTYATGGENVTSITQTAKMMTKKKSVLDQS